MKAIIFDFDETLVNSKDLAIKLYNQIADISDYNKIFEKDIPSLKGMTVIDRCKMLKVPTYKIPFIAAELTKLYKKHLYSITFKDGMLEVLKSLKKEGYNLGIISSNSVSNIKEFLEYSGNNIFGHIYSSKKLFGKHAIIKNYIKIHSLNKENVIYVGDEARDIVAAKKAGVKVIAVTWGIDSVNILQQQNPDYIAHKPMEILNIVSKY